jgi:hypothetical protein
MLCAFIHLHNEGFRTGSFALLADLFDEQGVMYVDARGASAFVGRGAIGRAFAGRGPTDELRILEVHGDDSQAIASYARRTKSGREAGMIHVEIGGGGIIRLSMHANTH